MFCSGAGIVDRVSHGPLSGAAIDRVDLPPHRREPPPAERRIDPRVQTRPDARVVTKSFPHQETANPAAHWSATDACGLQASSSDLIVQGQGIGKTMRRAAYSAAADSDFHSSR